MARKIKSIEDFEADGFEIYSEGERPEKIVEKIVEKKSPYDKSSAPAKVIIMDNTDVLKAVEASNKTLKEGMEKLVKSMYSMHPTQEQPSSISVKIERDSRGLMVGATLKVNK